MDLQELSYFTHVKYCLEHKEQAQIKIRRWYQFLKLKPVLRVYVYSGAYLLVLKYRFTISENGVCFRSDDDKTECMFNSKKEQREYFLRIILRAKICYFINNDRYDNLFIIL